MTDAPRNLDAYNSKRDFRKTSEPPPDAPTPSGSGHSRFVIQKHAARTLHYDFRLESDGVLKSWAVPKGPSTDPREKRLAVRTEDHPLAYIDFEGTIPDGEYGAGSVIVWDRGTYRNISERDGRELSLSEALEEGHCRVWLEGKKLQGGFALIRTQREKPEKWLLVKMDDDHADARRRPTSTEPESIISGRTIEQIARHACDR